MGAQALSQFDSLIPAKASAKSCCRFNESRQLLN